MSEKLLDVKNLHTSFFTHLGEVQAIRDVSFGLDKGEIIGIVGESGSGKSVTSLSIMGLLAYPGRVKDGEILFNGEDLLKKKKSEMRKIQGDHIAMIFQDPMTSLNPLFKIGDQITEAILTHHKIKKEDAKISIDFNLDDENLKRYMRGESFAVDCNDGWCLVCVNGYPLGWGKVTKGRLKNKYLPSWMNI